MAASGILVPSLHTTTQLELNVDRCKSGTLIKKGSVLLPGLSTNKGLFSTGEGSAPKLLKWSSTHGLARQLKSNKFTPLVCKAVASPVMKETSGGMSLCCLH
jgi:hypothetical protein